MTITSSLVNGAHTVKPKIELIFLGTGTSTSVPYIDCLTRVGLPDQTPCNTCLSTLTLEGKKNIRRNTSAVLRISLGDGRKTTVVIDVGKNFQAAALEWFPKYGLREIDAVLITHDHADAMNGLDDLRAWTLQNAIQEHVDVYVSSRTFEAIKASFPYLVSPEFATGCGAVPDLNWHIIEGGVPFEIRDTGVQITPFLVQHGILFTPNPPSGSSPIVTQPATPVISGQSSPTLYPPPFWCFGFIVQDSLVYMSDVSFIPEDAWATIERGKQKSMLVLDCLKLLPIKSHMGVRDAAATIQRLNPTRTYLIGFNHDLSHEEWVMIGKAAGKTPFDTSDMTQNVKDGIALLQEGVALIHKEFVDGEKGAGEDGGVDEKINTNGVMTGEERQHRTVDMQDSDHHWVRPSHDGLRVFLHGDTICDATYD